MHLNPSHPHMPTRASFTVLTSDVCHSYTQSRAQPCFTSQFSQHAVALVSLRSSPARAERDHLRVSTLPKVAQIVREVSPACINLEAEWTWVHVSPTSPCGGGGADP